MRDKIYISNKKKKQKMFNQLKRTHQNASEANETNENANKKARVADPVKQVQKKEKKPMFFKTWNEGDFVPTVEPDYTNTPTVKIKDGVYDALITTPPLSIRYSEMGPKGNLGTRYVSETAFTSAKFTMTLEKGVDDKVLAAMPNLEKEQSAYMKWLDGTSKQMLKEAWDNKLAMYAAPRKKCMAEAKKAAKKDKSIDVEAKAFELFCDGAGLPAKTELDDDGDPISTLNKMGRRYQYTDRKTGEIVINRPTIWKRTKEGGYEDITSDIRFFSKKSLVITAIQFRCYAMPTSYGVATDMGKHVILVWAPNSGSKPRETKIPDIPYFE